MISVTYLADCKGAEKFGTCVSCGKDSKDDPQMVRVTYSYHEGRCRTSTCLCDECRHLLFKKI